MFRFQSGKAFLVCQGDVAFHQTVVEDIDFAVFQIAEQAEEVDSAADAATSASAPQGKREAFPSRGPK